MKNNEEKIYINGSYLEKEFENGGRIIKCDIPNVSEFADQLIQHSNEKGKITLDIKMRQEKTDTGISHYIQVSQFAPQEQIQQTKVNEQPLKKQEAKSFDDIF